MNDVMPPDAVTSPAMRVVSALIGTATFFATLILFGYGALALLFIGNELTLTGVVVFSLSAIPLGFAFYNSIQIMRGVLWRVLPWAAWLVALFILLLAIHLFFPHYFPIYAPVQEGWNG